MLFVLGAPDPEMQAIENLLKSCNVPFAYAVAADGQRVHPGSAYSAVDTHWPGGSVHGPAWGAVTHLVECGAVPSACIRGDIVVVDHHRPGDPGFGKPPAEFFSASSIGQVVSLLAKSISTEFMHVAAADHCLAAAYRGECPGVDPDALMAWRIKSRSEFQRKSCKTCGGTGLVPDGTYGCQQCGTDDHEDCYNSNQKFCPDCSEDAILQKVAAARAALVDARSLILSPGIDETCGRCEGCGVKCAATEDDESWDYCECPAVRDMRGIKCPELPEASAREGVCFVSDGLADRDGRVKVVCQSGSPEQIRAFIEKWAPANGLIDIYGDPARGFAGGYLV